MSRITSMRVNARRADRQSPLTESFENFSWRRIWKN